MKKEKEGQGYLYPVVMRPVMIYIIFHRRRKEGRKEERKKGRKEERKKGRKEYRNE